MCIQENESAVQKLVFYNLREVQLRKKCEFYIDIHQPWLGSDFYPNFSQEPNFWWMIQWLSDVSALGTGCSGRTGQIPAVAELPQWEGLPAALDWQPSERRWTPPGSPHQQPGLPASPVHLWVENGEFFPLVHLSVYRYIRTRWVCLCACKYISSDPKDFKTAFSLLRY